jgi:YD repeat-containing protein
MKRVLLSIAFLLAFSVEAFPYGIDIISNIPLTDNLTAIAVNPTTGIAAAVSGESKALYLIDTNSNTVLRKVSLDMTPSAVAVDEKRNTAIISSKDGNLHFIDLASGTLLKTAFTGRLIHSIAITNPPIPPLAKGGEGGFSDQRSLLYIGSSNSLTMMDLTTGNIVREVFMPGIIEGIDVDNSLGYIVMITNENVIARSPESVRDNEAISKISFYNAATFDLIDSINPPSSPFRKGGQEGDLTVGEREFSGIAVNPSTHIVVITNRSGNSISIISLADKTLLGEIPFFEGPSAVAVDPARNSAFIAHKGGIAIVKLENPIPSIEKLIPEESQAGSPGLTLSIKGSRFIRDSRARFNLKELDTLFEDNYNLKALVPSEELLSPVDVPVTVLNPEPGGGVSNSLFFRIINPVPQIESLAPDAVALTAPPTELRIRGKNFLPNSFVNLNGKNLNTRFISSILLEAQLDLSGIKVPARYPVTVINPSPVSLTSNVAFLDVVEDETSLTLKKKEVELKEKSEKTVGSLTGRILNTYKQPIEGVRVQIRSEKAETDAGGYFTLNDVPSGRQHLMIHGSTATDKDSKYPTIPLNVNIEADKINVMPFQIYLHRQKDKNFKEITPGEETILTDSELPGFEIRIPKGVKITGWDGKPNQKVSVRTVPTDRLPVKPIPANSYIRSVYMFYFDKVGGGVPEHPIPVKSPNDLKLLPGEKAVLWYYDESPNEGEAPNDWAIAGTGTVTPDGMHIVSDPGVGIPKFCCGAVAWGGPPGGPPGGGDDGCEGGTCCAGPGGGGNGGGNGGYGGGSGGPQVSGTAGDPVDLATGYFIHAKQDLYVPGIIPVSISRYYRSGDTNVNTFGRGTYFEYDWWLGDYGDMLLLIKPGNYRYQFARQADGTYINTADPKFRGAVVTYNAVNDTRTLRLKDGTKYKFNYKDRMSGELIEIEDRNGNKLTFTRRPRPAGGDDFGGYMTEITTPEGRKITFNQSYVGSAPTGIFRTNEIVDHTGRKVTYTYETDPFSQYTRLKKVTYPDSSTIEYRYDSSGRLSEIINEKGVREVLNEYDANNRVIRQTHSDGGVYTFNYTVAGGYVTETSMTAPNGAVTTWRFNSYTYITDKTTPDGTTTYEREPGTNQILSVTDPMGRKMTYTYDAKGNVTTMTDNVGNTITYEYEGINSQVTSITCNSRNLI